MGERGSKPKSDVTRSKKNITSKSYFDYNVSCYHLLSLFHSHSYVVVILHNTSYVKNVLILVNIGPKVPIKFHLIFSPEFVTFLGATRGEGV